MKNAGKTRATRLITLAVASAILFAQCTSTTMIRSTPEGARITINGEHLGTTPVVYSDTKIIGSLNEVVLEKEGYETLYVTFSRDEQPDVGAIVAGCFFWIPFLWAMEYKPYHNYELRPAGTTTPGPDREEKLRELKRLHDEKLINDSEYEAARKKILDI